MRYTAFKLRLVISGAAALDPEVAKGFEAMGIKVLQDMVLPKLLQ